MNAYRSERAQSLAGVCSGSTAFLIWGLSPLYWKMLASVPSLEIILHRIIWSGVFMMVLVLLKKQGVELIGAVKSIRNLVILTLTALLVSANWLLFIWSINTGQVLQASLGYYINPLVNVCLGMLFLKERLSKPQILAVVLAAIGVLILTLKQGQLPWIALTLALMFSVYGLLRKIAPVGAMLGLTIETLMLSVPAILGVILLGRNGQSHFLTTAPRMDLLLIGSGLVTALPLLLFALSTRLLRYATVGILQYTSPTGMFLLGVLVFREPFSRHQIVAFALIWTALAVYAWSTVRAARIGAEPCGDSGRRNRTGKVS